MIEPYMVFLWIGSLSFIMVICTIMDLITVSKEEDIPVIKEREHSYKPSYMTDDYEDVNLYSEEDSLFTQGD